MRTSTVLSVLSVLAVSAGLAVAADTNAPEVNNTLAASYFAVLPNRVDTEVRGTITISSAANGKGANVAFTLSGLPATGGPFIYHIHDKPVPADLNCTGAGAHLDPYARGESPPCDADHKESCQVGDLSGKYGNITTTGYSIAYTDKFLSLVPGTPAYFGNRSLVVHFANKTRITCANFTTISTGYETPVIPGGFSTAAPSGSGVPSSSANATSYAASSHIATTPTLAPSAASSGAPPSSTGTSAASPTNWVSSGVVMGALGAIFAVAL